MENYNKVLNLFIQKAKTITKQYPDAFMEIPACTDGQYFSADNLKKAKDFMHIMNWTTSFFSGIALLAYEASGDKELLKWANSKNDLYYSKVFDYSRDTMHDIGFLYSLHSVALYKLTGDPYSKRIALKAADELAKRFVVKGGYIKAWGRMDNTIPGYVLPEDAKDHFFTESMGLAIIDCMMNLPLLYWAWTETGNSFYRDVADSHATLTRKLFLRDDDSVFHSYRFDPESGTPIKGCNYCGYSDDSYWARGATWAIYGFIIAYSYTHNQDYLDTSIRLAKGFINQLSEDDPVPVWDFYLPKHEEQTKDTSAAVIAASAFLEIIKHKHVPEIERFAHLMLSAVTSDKYTNYDSTVPGTLKEQNGRHTYASYGDYYYFEAICKASGVKKDMYW